MSGPEFWQTPMGHRFYEHTLPELVKQLGRLADVGNRVLTLAEAVVRPARPAGSGPLDGPPSDPAGRPGSTGGEPPTTRESSAPR